ncbi:MAG: NlpC/P60 family protein [Pseudomonadota bacterium]
MANRGEVIAEARTWIGTPYRHQASRQGLGADCLGLIRGVWRNCIGPEPEGLPAYSPDWLDLRTDDPLLAAAQRHFREVPLSAARPADLLLFRMALGAPAKHCAIVASDEAIIHAYWGKSVTETRLVPWWQRRIVAAFQFPDIED